MVRSSVLGIGLAVALLALQVGGCGGGGGGGGAGTNGGGTAGTNGGGTAGTNGGGTAGTNGGGTAGTNGGGTAGTTGQGGSVSTGTAGTNGGGTAGTNGGGTAGTNGGGTAGTDGGGTAGTNGGGTAGTTGAGGGTGGAACPASITDKSTTCASEGLGCPKTCGVESKGSKTCTCTAGVFVCESVAPTCHYPAGTDLTCYHLPTPVPACPTGTVSNSNCTDAACMPCSGYSDSSGSAKPGYCVCVSGKYKCASDKEWPAQ